MTLLLSAWTVGLLLALLALGVYVSFRVFSFPDITVDGSFTLGASVAAVLMTDGSQPILANLHSAHLWPGAWVPSPGPVHPALATLCGMLAGALAGASTGVLHTRFKINGLLAGILVMTGLYSVNLFVLGKSNQPLTGTTLASYADTLAERLFGEARTVHFSVWEFSPREVMLLAMSLGLVVIVALVLYLFFRTDVGTAMRATGDNAQMITALGVDTRNMMTLGLAISNGLVALAGALFAQYQGFADVQMGIGMVVWGLASVIIGEAIVGSRQLGLALAGAVMGSVLFRLLIAMVLLAGLNPNYLKFVTAVFVFVALVAPAQAGRLRGLWRQKAHA
jgi:putative ABC transport system permease protein